MAHNGPEKNHLYEHRISRKNKKYCPMQARHLLLSPCIALAFNTHILSIWYVTTESYFLAFAVLHYERLIVSGGEHNTIFCCRRILDDH